MMRTIKHILLGIIVIYTLTACQSSNITEDNSLKKYFDAQQVTGCFALLDNGQNNFTIYNLPRYKDSAYLPASTFKIVTALVGLQTGVLSGPKMVIPWDKKIRTFSDGSPTTKWNKDLNLDEAFKSSAVPYFQEVARRIGQATMQTWLDSLHYGTQKIAPPIDSFWLNNQLLIKPDEQLGLIKKLYFGQLPFNKTNTEIVKKMMVQTANTNYELAYKTGWGYNPKGSPIGWIIGWIEENKHPYFFVLNLTGNAQTNPNVRTEILTAILTQLDFFKGKK